MPIATKIDLNQCGVAIKGPARRTHVGIAHSTTPHVVRLARRRLTNIAAADSGKAWQWRSRATTGCRGDGGMGAAIVAAVVVLVAVAIAPLLGKQARATIFFVVALFITESGMGARERPKASGPTAQETVGIAASTDYDRPSLPHDAAKNSATNLPPESQYSNLAFNNRKTMVAAMATLASSEFLCGKKLSSREWQEAGVFALIFGYRRPSSSATSAKPAR
jgi:hypothetical protein